jgi:hypothetical protein
MATEDKKYWIFVLVLSIIGTAAGLCSSVPGLAAMFGMIALVAVALILVVALIKLVKK